MDNTDLYAFVAPTKKDSVTVVANFIPFQEPNGGPNFYPFEDGSRYDINIDNDGDAKADIIYRYQFKSHDARGNDTFLYNNGAVNSVKDKTLLFKQTYTLTKIEHGRYSRVARGTVAPSNVGKASIPDYKALRDETIAKVKTKTKVGARPSRGRPMTPSLPTFGCSTCSTAVTCPRPGRTRWAVST